MTEDEAFKVIGIAKGFAEHLSSKIEVGSGYVKPAKKYKRYLPTLQTALDTLVEIHDERKKEMAYRSRDLLLSHTLTIDEVHELIRLHKEGWTLRQLGDEFGVHRNTVSNILNRAKKQGIY